MGTDTTLTIKINKKLRDDAKRTARSLGIPLTTVMKKHLERFVDDQEITLSRRPTVRPEKLALWKKIREEMGQGVGVKRFDTVEDLIADLELT